MKKFARCVLILILVIILSGVGGYFYEDRTITPMYESVSRLYVVPGVEAEASIRSKDGGLNDDFTIIFSSDIVIEKAQRLAETSEDISQYLTITSPANSNIVELRVVNPDQNTAKTYVDAVAKSAVKTNTIIPVESIQILSEGTDNGVAIKPHLYRNTLLIAGAASAVCIFIEIVVCLMICAFRKKEDHSDDEYEYETRYGRLVYIRPELLESEETRRISHNTRKYNSDDILAAFDDEDDDEYDCKYNHKPERHAEPEREEKKYNREFNIYRDEDLSKHEAAAGREESKTEEPRVEEPRAEKPRVEEPRVEEPVIEEPKVEEPVITEPVIEEPKVEEPVIEAPVVEASKEEEPVIEEPVVEEPKEEEPAIEEPKVEESVIEAPEVEEPKIEAPVITEPVIEEPKIEAPVIEAPVVEEPKVEEPEVEAPKVEEPIIEEPVIEETITVEPVREVRVLGRICK